MPPLFRSDIHSSHHPALEGGTIDIARRLIGCRLVTEHDGQRCSGMIVETEAYLDKIDEASHSFRGETARNRSMFGPPGRAYVYLIYGVHCCVNVVTEAEGIGAAVLIRAVEPLEGLEWMRERREFRHSDTRLLCSGPGRVCSAFGITREHDGCNLFEQSSPIRIESNLTPAPCEIGASPRIGISRAREQHWRFFLLGSSFVSRASRGFKQLSTYDRR